MPRTAAALIIGNEILTGKIPDANLRVLATELRMLGVDLRRVIMCPDEIDVIASDVRTLAAQHDLLFTSGGVGPRPPTTSPSPRSPRRSTSRSCAHR